MINTAVTGQHNTSWYWISLQLKVPFAFAVQSWLHTSWNWGA